MPNFIYRHMKIMETETFPRIMDMCVLVPNLTTLEIWLQPDLCFLGMLRRLQPLEQLQQLCLTIDFGFRPPSQFNRVSFSETIDDRVRDGQEVPSLSTLRKLFLNTCTQRHDVFNSRLMHKIFPNVEMITISCHTQVCNDCKHKDGDDKELKLIDCLRNLVLPFNKCFRSGKLKRLFVGSMPKCRPRSFFVEEVASKTKNLYLKFTKK